MKKASLSFLFFIFISSAIAQFKFYEKGLDAHQAKDYANAIKNLNEYLDYTTRDKALDGEVHYILALSYFKTNSFTSAVREFDEALQAGHKNTGNIHWFMAKGYGHLKAPKESIEEYTAALGLLSDAPTQAKLLLERSQQYATVGNTSLAKADLTKAATLDNANGEIKKALETLSPPAIIAAQQTDSRTIKTPKKENNLPAGKAEKENNKVVPESKMVEKKEPEKTNLDEIRVAAKTQPDKKIPTENKIVAKTEPDKKIAAPLAAPPVAAEVKNEPTLADLYQDEKRYALVIGNSAYKYVAPLKNSANDANDMVAELTKLNFEVIKVIDGNYAQMREAYRKFQEKLANGPKDQTIGLFYYAGHGLQNEGENYLVPVEANIQYEDDIPRACFALQRVVVANMERSNSRMNIIILDACRNNPFPSAYRSAGGGLAEIKRAKGSFIAYATAPGSIASDGEGRNGLYTQELLKAMQKPGRTIEQVFKDVRLNVMKLSDEKQFTWDQSNIIGDFYFKF